MRHKNSVMTKRTRCRKSKHYGEDVKISGGYLDERINHTNSELIRLIEHFNRCWPIVHDRIYEIEKAVGMPED